MLAAVGVASVDELFADIPAEVRFGGRSACPSRPAESEVMGELAGLAGRNRHRRAHLFLGAGVYEHYVPAVVDAVTSRSEFLTAYTPYQPERSQGVLQAIFEYQTAICELTGLDVSNASMYDGATAAGRGGASPGRGAATRPRGQGTVGHARRGVHPGCRARCWRLHPYGRCWPPSHGRAGGGPRRRRGYTPRRSCRRRRVRPAPW